MAKSYKISNDGFVEEPANEHTIHDKRVNTLQYLLHATPGTGNVADALSLYSQIKYEKLTTRLLECPNGFPCRRRICPSKGCSILLAAGDCRRVLEIGKRLPSTVKIVMAVLALPGAKGLEWIPGDMSALFDSAILKRQVFKTIQPQLSKYGIQLLARANEATIGISHKKFKEGHGARFHVHSNLLLVVDEKYNEEEIAKLLCDLADRALRKTVTRERLKTKTMRWEYIDLNQPMLVQRPQWEKGEMVGPVVVKRLRDEGGIEYALKGLSRYLFGAGKEKSNRRRSFTSFTPSRLLDAISEPNSPTGIKNAAIIAYKLLIRFATHWRITDFGRSPIFTQVTKEMKQTRKMYIDACNAGRIELELLKRKIGSSHKTSGNIKGTKAN